MTDEELLAWIAAEGARLDEALARFTEEAGAESLEALAGRCDALLDAIRSFHVSVTGGGMAPADDAGRDGRP